MIASRIALVCLNISLLALMIRTKVRTAEQPRPGIRVTAEGQIFEDLNKGQRRTTSYGNLKLIDSNTNGKFQQYSRSSNPALNPHMLEPFIDVKIMQRTKEHPSDDFKIYVNYQLQLTKDEQENLKKLVPATPRLDAD